MVVPPGPFGWCCFPNLQWCAWLLSPCVRCCLPPPHLGVLPFFFFLMKLNVIQQLYIKFPFTTTSSFSLLLLLHTHQHPPPPPHSRFTHRLHFLGDLVER